MTTEQLKQYLKTVQEQQKMLDPIAMGASAISGLGSMWDSTAEQRDIQNAGRQDLADSIVGNSWTDIFNNSDRLAQGLQTVDNNKLDVSGVNDINTLSNIGIANNLQDNVTAGTSNGGDIFTDAGEGAKLGATIGSFIPGGTAIGAGIGLGLGAISGFARSVIGDINNKKNARALNARINQANAQQINDLYDRAGIINQKQLRQNMINYFAEGGSLEELNGVTKIGAGSTHEQNPNDGVQMGIAPDNLPNLVEEGEVVYKDYVYSNRLKPSKSLLKQYNLPEKYAGKTFAELAEILQKESEDRPNDPVSLQTLEDWMSRLTGAQEEYKAKQEERRLAKVVDNMSDEEKAAIMYSLVQSIPQQEGIDLGQPMYAKGGGIHIAPSKKGTFTAAAKKHGKSVQAFASQVLANKENYSPAMVRKANFARNSAKWHSDGGHLAQEGMYLDIPPYADTSSPYYGLEGLEITPKEYIPLNVVTSDIFPDEPDNRSDYLYTSYMKPISSDAVYDKHGNIRYNDLDRMYSDPNHRPTTFDGINEEKYFDMFYHPIGNKFIYESFPADANEKWFTALSKLPEFQALKNKPKDAKEAYNWFNAYAAQERPMDDFAALVNSLRIKNSPLQTKVTTKPEGWGYLKETPSDETTPTSSLKRRKRTNNSDPTEMLRYAPVLGSAEAMLRSAIQPKDFTVGNEYRQLSSQLRPIAAPHVGGYRRYNPYDVNLGDIENIALTANALAANRGQNRATQGALNAAVINAAQKTAAARNLAAQQANESNRLAVDTYNLGIDQFNANRDTQYDQLNQQILQNKLNMLMSAAQADDASKEAWANMYNTTRENFFNQLGNVGKDEWNRKAALSWTAEHPELANTDIYKLIAGKYGLV